MSWKKFLNQAKNVALPVAGFALGGPAGAAAGGALAGGIGYGRPKLGRVAKGAALGYAGGSVASGLGVAGGQGFGAMGSSAKAAAMNPRQAIGGLFTGSGEPGSRLGRVGEAAGAVGKFSKEYPSLTAGVFQGAATAYGSNQQAAALERQIALQEKQDARAAEAEEEERRRRIRVAQLLAPLFQQMQQQTFP